MNRSTSMYQDMASRTGSSIYIGVVGPVRTGKSTFIKRFMETQVLPNIENDYRRERARDELPQSGSGRTVMRPFPCGSSTAWGTWFPVPWGSSRIWRPGWS